ncbi:hypothetical protein [Chryseobacterium sp.]|uniref:hypothetical protein n=1 Tax=Chryseobacterium sp. TaxID=1871047 RepID=UPI002FC86A8E
MNILDTTFDFEERFVAFIDILGFKELIFNLEKGNKEELKKIKSILNFMNEETIESRYDVDLPIYEINDNGLIEKELGNPRMLYVSDCMVISADPTLDGFKILSNKIHKIISDLAVDGYFCRGAITKGSLFHHGNILFGSAYMRAYQLEPEAIYPRIIIDPNILHFFDLTDDKVPLAPIFYGKDNDGFYYLKYFTIRFFPPYLSDWTQYLLIVKNHIVSNLHKNYKSYLDSGKADIQKKIYLKYQWLAKEFNRNIDFYDTYFSQVSNSEQEYYQNLQANLIKEFGDKIPTYNYETRKLEKIIYEEL